MATEKQIAANRINAKRSTGPRSAEGKRRARNNAFRHGFVTSEWRRQLQRELDGLDVDARCSKLNDKRFVTADERTRRCATSTSF